MSKLSDQIIKELQLEPHIEGGYFRQTYATPRNITIQKEDGPKERALMTVIYYILTVDSPTNHFNRNTSDIIHFYHCGLPIKYHVLTPDGQCSSTILGPDILAGQKLQFMVPGGCWKASELMAPDSVSPDAADFNLISEAVAPGFDYDDWVIAGEDDIKKLLPQTWESYKRFIKY